MRRFSPHSVLTCSRLGRLAAAIEIRVLRPMKGGRPLPVEEKQVVDYCYGGPSLKTKQQHELLLLYRNRPGPPARLLKRRWTGRSILNKVCYRFGGPIRPTHPTRWRVSRLLWPSSRRCQAGMPNKPCSVWSIQGLCDTKLHVLSMDEDPFG